MAWLFQFVFWGHLFSYFVQNSLAILPSCPARIYAASYFKTSAGLPHKSDQGRAQSNTGHPKPLSSGLMCKLSWKNREDMIGRARDEIKNRQKVFLRFRSPVYFLNDASLRCEHSGMLQTWVWVKESHEYMLYYPHNFVVLSFITFRIIAKDLANVEEDCVTVSSQSGSNLGSKECSLNWQDVQYFMYNVTKGLSGTDWRYICLQLDYNVSDVIQHPHLAIPDSWYYWRFLRLYISKKLLFKTGNIFTNHLMHYRCYNKKGEVREKELMHKYYVILIIAVILWLYFPLLVYYLPSSKPMPSLCYPQGVAPEDFYPSYKSPKRVGTFLRYVLCFYMKKNQGLKARLRRGVFFVCFSLVSYRILPIPGSSHFNYTFPLFGLFVVALMVPDFLSVHLKQDFPKRFLDLWEYPEGVFRATSKTEYQFLAHCIRERIYLTADSRFWAMLWRNKFKLLPFEEPKRKGGVVEYMRWTVLSLPGVFCFFFLLLINLIYYFTPAFYFYKELFLAIATGLQSYASRNQYSFLVIVQSVVYGTVLTVLLAYLMLTMFFWCYLLAEVIMFTYIGVIVLPTMAFKYVVLLAAVVFFFHKTANDIRKNYDQLRDQVIKLLENPASLKRALAQTNTAIIAEEQAAVGSYQIVIQKNSAKTILLHCEDDITYLSRHLFDTCIEACDPLRRHMCFYLVIAFLMFFYILTAMWVKNVYHKEKEVSSIFTIAQITTTYFIPNLLQFLAHKSHFNESDGLLKQRVRQAIVEYAKRI